MASALERRRPGHTMPSRVFGETPLRDLTRLESRMDDLFDQMWRNALSTFGAEALSAGPALDVIDRKDETVLRADMPGMEQKDIDVQVQDGTVTVHGKRTEEHKEKEEDYCCAERWAGEFSRQIVLPAQVEADKVEATFKNGVLEVHLPKSKASEGRKVEIKAS